MELGSDCDDQDANIYPDAPEDCDGVDQNCNGNNFYELDLDGNGLLACQESIWVRNTSNYTVNPVGNCSQAGDLLLDKNMTITQYYHGNTSITSALLENYGLYVHHGNNQNGALGAYTNAEANVLQNWVYDGGRMLIIGHSAVPDPCVIADSFPSQFGISCDVSYSSWSGNSTSFVSHPVTASLGDVGGSGGENWVINSPAETLIYVDGYELVAVVEYGAGKVVLVANQRPFHNSSSGYNINYGDNAILVDNIWTWLLAD